MSGNDETNFSYTRMPSSSSSATNPEPSDPELRDVNLPSIFDL